MEFDYKNIIKSKNRRIKELLNFNDILEKQHIEKMKEIERLKEDNEYLNKVNIELSTEKNRLNNIINELEHDFESYELEYLQETYQGSLADFIETELERIQELKGSDTRE